MNADIASMFAEGVRPPDRRPPWQWCEDHIPAIPYSPMPGRFRSDNSPWVREVMEVIVDPRVKLVSILASVQSSKTTIPELTLCYIVKNLPGPCLWLDQTDEDAKDQSESRLQKLFEECEPVRDLFPRDRHKRRNHTVHFSNGMTLWILGAHNKTNLQRRSIRWLFGDETWRWPAGNMAEAEARVTAFGWLGKCVFMSQGGEENDDTHRKFETTDMREWTFACPHCGKRQPFAWENVEWSKSARDAEGNWDFSAVRDSTILRCTHCNHYFTDSDATRRQLNATGKYICTNTNASPENVGFHWNALCAMSWGKLAELYLRAKAAARQGDTSLLQQFYQKRLALPWREYVEDYKMEIATCGYRKGESWEEEGGITRQGKVVAPPFEGAVIPLRILTVDCQMDHLFAVVRSWSPNGSSRLVWNERLLTFDDIELLQERYEIHPNLVFVDAGHATYDVYRQCSKKGWVALIGDRRLTFPHKSKEKGGVQRFYSPRRKVVLGTRQSCYVHYWSNLNIKDTLARLRRNQDPAKGPTWEVPDDIDEDYLSQMESEHRAKEKNTWMWKQIGKRPNHYWDCESMQAAAATMLKIIGRESVVDTPASGNGGRD
ncbi:terminase gpA endonuclease subunit [Ruficoccus sp. ZRK36]|uniref:terminase gpA endonuclease subunit n=1 Tax=Ruficoccus sp. ZRK36 TaxID=2866311 RepID=UPI001C732E34|nr:terminase gpA endonuclease subunit [Ruficoccus sp. ZRK36]QYY34597.1 phage terminase large subunit family protein [Ruficoccus sp. ZRK36]